MKTNGSCVVPPASVDWAASSPHWLCRSLCQRFAIGLKRCVRSVNILIKRSRCIHKLWQGSLLYLIPSSFSSRENWWKLRMLRISESEPLRHYVFIFLSKTAGNKWYIMSLPQKPPHLKLQKTMKELHCRLTHICKINTLQCWDEHMRNNPQEISSHHVGKEM